MKGRTGQSGGAVGVSNGLQRRQIALASWFLIPGLLLVAFLALPVLRVLGTAPAHLPQLVRDAEVRSSLLLTFACAAAATLVGVVLSVPLGYALAREPFKGQRIVMTLVDMPLVIPHPVAGIALLLLLARTGIVGRLLAAVHLNAVGTSLGITIAMLLVSSPYLVHSCRNGFREVDVRYEQLARTLGCGRWRAFWRVVLPMARAHIVSGAILMLARAVSEFGALVILAYNPRVISILIYDRFNTFGINQALPIAGFLVLFAFCVVWLTSVLERVSP